MQNQQLWYLHLHLGATPVALSLNAAVISAEQILGGRVEIVIRGVFDTRLGGSRRRTRGITPGTRDLIQQLHGQVLVYHAACE